MGRETLKSSQLVLFYKDIFCFMGIVEKLFWPTTLSYAGRFVKYFTGRLISRLNVFLCYLE